MLFATLILEREPLAWGDIFPATMGWLQSAGALAALGLFLYFAASHFSFKRMFSPMGLPVSPRMVSIGGAVCALAWLGFCLLATQFALAMLGLRVAQNHLPGAHAERPTFGDWLFAASGTLALAVVLFPIVKSAIFDMRMGRIWAVAKLSIKETIRNRSIFVFGAMAIIFLFADWFIPYRPEDQVRNYVWVLYWSMIVLFLLTAGIFGSFSIPADIKSLNIHTVVTKPITKFEIVLGRFLGYGLILTIALFAVGFASLGYVMRGITDEASQESLLARVPVYAGRIGFINTRGESVGREWDYRKYIAGASMSGGKRQYAVWQFPDLSEIRPRADGTVRIEFAFDIFRLTKGEENKGILCTFKFADGMKGVDGEEGIEAVLERIRRERTRRQEAAANANVDLVEANRKIDAALVEEFPIWEQPGVEVSDYHTLQVDVPYALIEGLRKKHAEKPEAPAMQIFVSIDNDRGSAAQMLGVAPRDLYVLAAENDFYVNFLKGLVGLWMSTLMVLGVALCCSTYLSGVISLLCTLFLFIAGFFTPSIGQLANNQGIGGGPTESFYRMVGTRTPMTVPLDESSTTTLIKGTDEVFRWFLRRVLTLIPDASRYDLHPYVANGFDISVTRILFLDCFIPLVGYLLPWFVLAYYLINYREIANPM